MDDVPDFETATLRFADFLRDLGVDGSIDWIFSEDVILGRSPLVRDLLPNTNREMSKTRFSDGRRRGLGIMLHALFRQDSRILACVWYPKDEIEAEQSMISGLKLSLAEPLRPVSLCRGDLNWKARKWLAGDQADWMDGHQLSSRDLAAA